jgi:hypothetical protein
MRAGGYCGWGSRAGILAYSSSYNPSHEIGRFITPLALLLVLGGYAPSYLS